MILQISFGQGPKECELTVGKLFGALKEEYPDIWQLFCRQTGKKCYTSIIFSTDQDLSEMKGSVQWYSNRDQCNINFRAKPVS